MDLLYAHVFVQISELIVLELNMPNEKENIRINFLNFSFILFSELCEIFWTMLFFRFFYVEGFLL